MQRVGQTVVNDCKVSTVEAFDTGLFETAIKDGRYHWGWIVVEQYETWEAAEAGHLKWSDIMATKPPETLQDVLKEDWFESAGFADEPVTTFWRGK